MQYNSAFINYTFLLILATIIVTNYYDNHQLVTVIKRLDLRIIKCAIRNYWKIIF